MCDNELMRRVAELAGLHVKYVNGEYVIENKTEDGVTISRSAGKSWNPRNDDGDSMRLAAALRIDISYGADSINGEYVTAFSNFHSFREPITILPAHATREAVFKAAAALAVQLAAVSE